jgi:hypothetical protein
VPFAKFDAQIFGEERSFFPETRTKLGIPPAWYDANYVAGYLGLLTDSRLEALAFDSDRVSRWVYPKFRADGGISGRGKGSKWQVLTEEHYRNEFPTTCSQSGYCLADHERALLRTMVQFLAGKRIALQSNPLASLVLETRVDRRHAIFSLQFTSPWNPRSNSDFITVVREALELTIDMDSGRITGQVKSSNSPEPHGGLLAGIAIVPNFEPETLLSLMVGGKYDSSMGYRLDFTAKDSDLVLSLRGFPAPFRLLSDSGDAEPAFEIVQDLMAARIDSLAETDSPSAESASDLADRSAQNRDGAPKWRFSEGGLKQNLLSLAEEFSWGAEQLVNLSVPSETVDKFRKVAATFRTLRETVVGGSASSTDWPEPPALNEIFRKADLLRCQLEEALGNMNEVQRKYCLWQERFYIGQLETPAIKTELIPFLAENSATVDRFCHDGLCHQLEFEFVHSNFGGIYGNGTISLNVDSHLQFGDFLNTLVHELSHAYDEEGLKETGLPPPLDTEVLAYWRGFVPFAREMDEAIGPYFSRCIVSRSQHSFENPIARADRIEGFLNRDLASGNGGEEGTIQLLNQHVVWSMVHDGAWPALKESIESVELRFNEAREAVIGYWRPEIVSGVFDLIQKEQSTQTR